MKNQYLDVAIKAAKEAGKIILKNFRKIKTITDKGNDSFFTNVDLASEKKIISVIKNEFPDHNFLAEEVGTKDIGSEYTWIIDPIDGTHEYMHGFDYFGISIALAKNNKVLLGVIYFPILKKLYYAVRGKGAYSGGKRLHVSKRKLKSAYVLLTGNLKKFQKEKLKAIELLAARCFRIRIYGAAVYNLCNIAEGNAEAIIEWDTNPWDIAAGFLIVEEAGGKITDFKGNKWTIRTKDHIASNGIVHEEIRKILKRK